MAIDQHLAAVHFRVIMAGEALEHAVTDLKNTPSRVARGRIQIQTAVNDLEHAKMYLQASGQYPSLLAYVEKLIEFYKGQLSLLGFRPQQGPAVGENIYNAQGTLLAADPFHSGLVK